ncbi:hypothetical protein FEM48_Zijuj06G0208600 [Ziziphus jujuba var. spinosa]|uniref:Protein ECERIFERUM 1-like n=1 Tax=Ziziphus jujuba var. spinosa TaxID=714518 RepID=A0A978VBJ9_ZIZJJ|nr:hypothetical protein FEM48_Zijuj06G0208600 [Ziziphus jujuba var. spinosa]
MAFNPGILTDWPWKSLGSFKIWITLSRYRTTKGNNRILDRGLEFDQVDRERNWDDQILLNGILLYVVSKTVKRASNLPLWRADGVVITILLHVGPVEFLYYWLHRALHHHFVYSRYHSHHHSSIVTEPITSVIHPFGEHLAYFVLFATPILTTLFTGTVSIASYTGYITFIDFMNNMGHCNFELVPIWLFSIFPPLKYLMYTPSFHSLHHTQFRTNYSLFMPIYDYIYGTMDKSSDSLYETSLKREEEVPDVVHLTHLTTPESIYHLRLGFASLASKPHTSSIWYLWLMWPVTMWTMMLAWIYGRTFVVERHRFDKLRLQTWSIPKYKFQSEELNRYGRLYVEKNPKLKVKLVDGSSLAVAVVLNNIPKGTTQVLLRGKLAKVAYALALALCQKGIQVATLNEDEYLKLNKSLSTTLSCASKLVLSKCSSQKIWLVGDELSDEEQLKASKGTIFIPFSQFPPKKLRKDCFYHYTPAMVTPTSLENLHSCENWLPRRVMSAWRIAGMVHALEGYEHECGNNDTISNNIDKIWEATLQHGFQPIMNFN